MTDSRKHTQPSYSFDLKEKLLVDHFVSCRLLMSPNAFVDKWSGISRSELAFLCQTDLNVVNRWFSQGKSHKKASLFHQRTIAIADIFLEFYNEFPPSLIRKLNK